MKNANKIFSVLLVFFVCLIVSSSNSYSQETAGQLFEKALYVEESEGDLQKAIDIFQKIVKQYSQNREAAAKAQLHIGLCYEKLGLKEAEKSYQKVIENFPDQKEAVERAREKLSSLQRAWAALETGDKEFNIRRIWEGPDVDFSGAVSPDGNYICYTDSRTYDLALWELATGKRRRLTTNPNTSGYCGSSIFSPDGKQVAFAWSVWDTELRIIGVDGSNPRTLIRNKNIQPVDWSPDGNHILALTSGANAKNKIVLVSVSDGAMRTLKTFDWRSPRKMCFSPDGRTITYDFPQQENSKDSDIFLLATDGSRETRLIDHPADDHVLGWTPDGKGLLFASNRTGSVGAWIIQVTDGQPLEQPKLVKRDIGLIRSIGVTKKGSLFYGHYTGIRNVYLADLDPTTNKVIAEPAPLSQQFVVANFAPDWSPDGKSLAYRCERISGFGGPRSRIISIRSLDTGKERELLPAMRGFYLIKWSPDGQSFLLVGYDNKNRFGLHIVDAQTGNITTTVLNGYWGSWSGDGKAIFYAKNDASTKSRTLVVRDLESGEDKVLFQGLVGLSVAVSPDGEQIAFSGLSGEQYELAILYVLSPKEGKPREIFRLKNPEDFGSIAWSPDGRMLLFARRNFQVNKAEVWQIAVEGGQPQNIGLSTTDMISPISIHPDGRRIAFSSGQRKAEVWVMENFLPVEKAEKELTIRQVMKGGDANAYGEPSPDGKYLSYTDWETGDLAIRELATGKTRRLTNKGTQKQPAVFALNSVIPPDNKLVAYSWTNEYGTYDLCLIGIDGSGNRILYNSKDKDEVYPASWSSDGNQIAARRYSTKGEKAEIISIAVSDGSVQVLKTFEKLFWPRFCYSPDDRFIAYDFPVAENSENHDISLISTDGSGEIFLIEHPANDRLLGWTPGREEILFVSNRTGTHDIWAIEVANGKVKSLPRPVKRDIGQISPQGFTKDGSFYLSVDTRWFTTQIAPFDLKTGKVQEKLSKPLLGSNFSAEWSPDGKYLAYITEQTMPSGGTYHRPLHVLNLGTEEERELAGEFEVRVPRWSPDGRSILFTGYDNNRRNQKDYDYNGGVYKIDVQTGNVTELVQFPPIQEPVHINYFRDVWWGHSIADWSHDGKDVFYVNRGRIFIRELESGREKQLYQNSNLRKLLDLSPDGNRLVFGTENSDDGTWSILIMPISGGEPRELCKLHESERIRFITWTPDGKYVFFTENTKKVSALWRISPEGGDPQKLWQSDKRISGLSIHPDGQQIAFSTSEHDEEIWVMENFLPEETK